MNHEHDTLAFRLSAILNKLNSGESFTVSELAEEFNVHKRTIQKDLNERLQFLPIKKENTRYSIESYCLGQLSFSDIKNFATLSGIQDLYPELEDSFIVDLLSTKVNHSYLIKGYEYENVQHQKELFDTINSAIITHRELNFDYHDKTRTLKPYKLINTDGIWYIAGEENKELKTFTLSKTYALTLTQTEFTPNMDFLQTIKKNQAQWFSQTSIDVIIEVDNSVAEYFLRRKLLPAQVTLKQTAQTLTLSAKVSYEEEILKVVRYWIPHIKIISPEGLQEKLQKSLIDYLN